MKNLFRLPGDYDGKIEAEWRRNEIEKRVDGVVKLREIRFQYHYRRR